MKFIFHYWITILATIVILFVCFVDTTPMPPAPMNNFDKLAHFFMFFGLSGIVFFENTNHWQVPANYQIIVLGSFLFPIVLSGLIEIGQEYLSPYRTGDWMDFLYDFLGAFVGFAFCLIINKRLPFPRKSH